MEEKEEERYWRRSWRRKIIEENVWKLKKNTLKCLMRHEWKKKKRKKREEGKLMQEEERIKMWLNEELKKETKENVRKWRKKKLKMNEGMKEIW